MYIKLQDEHETFINTNFYQKLWKIENDNSSNQPTKYLISTTPGDTFYYEDKNKRDNDYNKIVNLITNKGGIKMLKDLKEYYNKHQDVILTIGLVVLLDHFLFGGTLRDRIKTTLEKMLGNAEKKIGE